MTSFTRGFLHGAIFIATASMLVFGIFGFSQQAMILLISVIVLDIISCTTFALLVCPSDSGRAS